MAESLNTGVEGQVVNGLPHAEQIKLAVHIAVGEALAGKPAELGQTWLRIEELSRRRDLLKDVAATYVAKSKQCDQELELLTATVMAELRDRNLQSADAGFGYIARKTNGGSQAVEITGTVPQEWTKSKTTISNDLTKIGQALREGEILDFACLAQRGEHLSLEAV
jgi:hypothetical protein